MVLEKQQRGLQAARDTSDTRLSTRPRLVLQDSSSPGDQACPVDEPLGPFLLQPPQQLERPIRVCLADSKHTLGYKSRSNVVVMAILLINPEARNYVYWEKSSLSFVFKKLYQFENRPEYAAALKCF